jgi:hypothetical protein
MHQQKNLSYHFHTSYLLSIFKSNLSHGYIMNSC